MGAGAGWKVAFEQVRYAVRVRLPSHVQPPTLEGHNFLVRTPFWVFLDSMESPLSQDSIRMSVEGSGCWSWPKM